MYETFGPQVKEYLKEKLLPLRCLLVMDNATAHPHGLDDDLPDGFYFIKVKFLPTNMTPFLQPVDQQVISSFKELNTRALFCKCFEVTSDTQLKRREFRKDHFTTMNSLTLIDNAWTQVTCRILNSAFEKHLARLCSRERF